MTLGAGHAAVVTRHVFGRRDSTEGGSVADLWSKNCRAKEEHETYFEGRECVAAGFCAHDITSRVLWCPVMKSFGLGAHETTF